MEKQMKKIEIHINDSTNKKLQQLLPKLEELYSYYGNDALWMIFLKGLDQFTKEILEGE
jgi:hypothetical protein